MGGDRSLSDVDDRIIDRFLRVSTLRPGFDAESARAILVEMYPVLANELEIVRRGERRVLVRRSVRSRRGPQRS